MLRVTIMIAPIKGVMAEPAGRPSDVQVRTRAEEDEYGFPTPRARAAELRAADPRLDTAGQIVEAVGIEQRISVRIRQLRGITGNRIPSDRNQNTRKSTFGKPFCQVAKPKPRRRREGRTWERRPPPRHWAAWHARFYRARGTPNRASWRAPFCSCWHGGAAPSDDPTKRPSRGTVGQGPSR